jgi:hypothetical protein
MLKTTRGSTRHTQQIDKIRKAEVALFASPINPSTFCSQLEGIATAIKKLSVRHITSHQ